MRLIRPVGTARDNPSVRPPIIELREGQDPEYEALLAVWQFGGTCEEESTEWVQPPTREQFEQLKRDGVLALKPVELDEVSGEPVAVEDSGYDDVVRIVLWYDTGDERGKFEEPNFGFGFSRDDTIAGTDKRANTWVHAEEWTPPAARERELLALSKEELVGLVLRAEARFTRW